MNSTYKGITPDRRSLKWTAQLKIAGRLRYLGRYDTDGEAALVVDNARFHLQEFFPKPFNPYLLNEPNQDLSGPPCEPVARLREQLGREDAPTYSRDPNAPETNPERLVAREAVHTLEEVLTTLRLETRKVENVILSLKRQL